MRISRNKLNRMGESKHPWQTPFVVLNTNPSWLFMRTALLDILYTRYMAWTSPPSMLKRLRTCMPQAWVPDSVRCLLEVNEVMAQIALMLQVLLYNDSKNEELFYCAPAWYKICLFFYSQFLSLVLQSSRNLGAWPCWDGWLGWQCDSHCLSLPQASNRFAHKMKYIAHAPENLMFDY